LDNFKFKSKDTLEKSQGIVYANYDIAFDAIYSHFLIFNSTEEKYIDFDSYSWVVDEAYTVLFSPDQEIILIDRHNKTVDRIAFRGPSQWVEDAYWQDDTIVVLSGNTYKNQPIISKIDLENKSVNTFIYKDSLTIKSDYSKLRHKKISLSYD
jgi:hypothetical protein